MRQNFTPLDEPVGVTVSFGTAGLRKICPTRSGIALKRKCGVCIHVNDDVVMTSLRTIHSYTYGKIVLFCIWTTATILFYKWTVNLFILLALSVTERDFSGSIDRKRKVNCIAPSFSRTGIPSFGLSERPVVQPKSEHTGWTQGTDHCFNSECNKRRVTARLARSELWVGCVRMQTYSRRPLRIVLHLTPLPILRKRNCFSRLIKYCK